MKKFETPEIEIVKFAVEDVLTVSGDPEETEQTFFVINGIPCMS